MRTLQVHFASGKDVLGRYWGMLRGGGLRLDLPMLPEPPGGPEAGEAGAQLGGAPTAQLAAGLDAVTVLPADAQCGERLQLHVYVQTIKKTFPVQAELLELTFLPAGPRAVIGFLPESPPNELLDAVWADGLDVPQRRSRRHELQSPVQFACASAADSSLRSGELRNLSLGGCCIAGPDLPPLGSYVMVQIAGGTTAMTLAGRVRWIERPDAGLMGIEFQSPSPTLAQILEALG